MGGFLPRSPKLGETRGGGPGVAAAPLPLRRDGAT